MLHLRYGMDLFALLNLLLCIETFFANALNYKKEGDQLIYSLLMDQLKGGGKEDKGHSHSTLVVMCIAMYMMWVQFSHGQQGLRTIMEPYTHISSG